MRCEAPSAMRIRPSGSRQDRRLSPLPHIILCETPEEFERTGYGGGVVGLRGCAASESTTVPIC